MAPLKHHTQVLRCLQRVLPPHQALWETQFLLTRVGMNDTGASHFQYHLSIVGQKAEDDGAG